MHIWPFAVCPISRGPPSAADGYDGGGGGNGENQYNNSDGNHRVKLSLGRPKQVCDRGRRWFTGVFFFRFYLFSVLFFYVRSVTVNLNATAGKGILHCRPEPAVIARMRL